MIFLEMTENPKDKSKIKEVILRLCSEWGGISNSGLKETLSQYDMRVCSECFKELKQAHLIRQVNYVTLDEKRWILT